MNDTYQSNYEVLQGFLNSCIDIVELEDLDQMKNLLKYFVDNTISLYPNPANTLVYVNAINTNESLEAVTIYDVIGKNVSSISKINSNQATLDVSTLAKGVYLVEITSQNNLKLIKKLIIE